MELDFTDLGWVGDVPSLNREIDWGWQLLPRMLGRIQFFCSFSCHNFCGKILTYKITCENHLNTSNRHAATDDTDLLVVGQCQVKFPGLQPHVGCHSSCSFISPWLSHSVESVEISFSSSGTDSRNSAEVICHLWSAIPVFFSNWQLLRRLFGFSQVQRFGALNYSTDQQNIIDTFIQN